MVQLVVDPERLVFIDETWASTNMAQRQAHKTSKVPATGVGLAKLRRYVA